MDGAADRSALLPKMIQKLATPWWLSWACTAGWIFDDELDADETAADVTSAKNAIAAIPAESTFRPVLPTDATKETPFRERTRPRAAFAHRVDLRALAGPTNVCRGHHSLGRFVRISHGPECGWTAPPRVSRDTIAPWRTWWRRSPASCSE